MKVTCKFEVFTAVTMKNAVSWDIETHFIPHRKRITFHLLGPAVYCYVRFEVTTAVTMKNAVFWDVTLRLHYQRDKTQRARSIVSIN
jgi:hypothetical protein